MKRIFQHAPSKQTAKHDRDDELAFHLQGRIEDLMARGYTREAAEAEARARFGDRETIEAELVVLDKQLHQRRAFREWTDDVLRDVKLAFRGLTRRPAFALTVIITLALGIGANTAIFSVADALLFRALPYPRPQELVSVWGASAGDLFGLRDLTHSFRSIASFSEWAMNVGDESAVARVEGADISANLFSTLGVQPTRGRDFQTGADLKGAPREVILSDGLWRSQFGGDSSIIGKSIFIEGVSRTVIGVMPASFQFPTSSTKLWLNSRFDPSNPGETWGWWKYKFVARMLPGITAERAQVDVKSAVPRIRKLNTVWDPGPTFGADASVTPIKAQLSGSARTTLLVLLGVVFALLLIACANVANLVLVRSMEREREFSMRVALGCSRGRLIRQLLTENLILSAVGGAAALALAWGGVAFLSANLPPQIPRTAPITVDLRVLFFTATLAVLAGITFGLGPSLRATRASRGRGLTRLAGATRSTSMGAEHRRIADGLTIAQLALAVVLVSGSGLLLRSLDALQQVDVGFDAEQTVAGRVTLSPGVYRELPRRTVFIRELIDKVAAVPGVKSVAAVDQPPLRETVLGMPVRIEGQFESLRTALPTISHAQIISAGYFETMGIPLKSGRAFNETDRDSTVPVAIISESLAKRFWANTDPIGKRVGSAMGTPWITIVGVVADVKVDSLSGTELDAIYRPIAQSPPTDFTIVARTNANMVTFATGLRSAVADMDKMTPVSDVRAMSDVVSSSLSRTRFTALLLTGFSALALLISAVGIYGVVSSNVSQRTREIGVRMALGASPASVVGLVMTRGAWLAAIGVALGLTGALFATRWMSSLIYGVSATDPGTFVAAPLLLMAVGLLATFIPARRAVGDSPLAALRND